MPPIKEASGDATANASIGVMGRGLSRPRVRYLLVGMNVTSRIKYSPVISRKLG